MNTLERQVLGIIGENPDAPDVFTDDDVGMAPIRDSINEAIQEIAMLSGGYTEKFYLPLRKDVAFYRLHLERGHFAWVEDAWVWDVKRRLEAVSILDLASLDARWMANTGTTPRCYYQVGLDVLGLWPRPTATSEVLQVTAAVIPAEYRNDSDRVKAREEFQSGLVNYAVAEYWAGRGDARSAETHFGLYAEVLGHRLNFSETPDREYTIGRSQAAASIPAGSDI